MSLERKHQIYRVCQKHDIVIIEDDAYYWLQFYKQEDRAMMDQEVSTAETSSIAEASKRGSAIDVPGLELPASFLSIDTDSRVVRIDTLSKLMGPG